MPDAIPQQLIEVSKVCPTCDQSYMGHPESRYCSLRCKSKAYGIRRRQREHERVIAATITTKAPDPRLMGTKADPSTEWITAAAATLPPNRFWKFTGLIPVADGTMLGKVWVGKNLKGEWNMVGPRE